MENAKSQNLKSGHIEQFSNNMHCVGYSQCLKFTKKSHFLDLQFMKIDKKLVKIVKLSQKRHLTIFSKMRHFWNFLTL